MILNFKQLKKLLRKNIEIFLLFSLMLITILSTTFYNNYKNSVNENYKNIINNIYFQKSLNHIFNNFLPKYQNIEHKISKGETFDKMLNSYLIPKSEIEKIKKKLIMILI